MGRSFIAAIAIVVTCLNAHAFRTVPFDLEQAAWDASDIIVVTQGEVRDGKCTVVETWKGGLKRGDTLTIPGLKDYAPPQTKLIQPGPGGLSDTNVPASASGVRLALFLQRSTSDPQKWEGTASDELGTSVVWFEQGRAYALAPGLTSSDALALRPLRVPPSENVNGSSELAVKLFVLDEVQQQGALGKAAQFENLEQRKQAFSLLTASKFKRISDAALAAIAALNATPAAPPTPTVSADAVPLIQFNSLRLDAAVRNLAHQAGLSVEFNPKLKARTAGENIAVLERPVTMKWENVSPRQALTQLLDTNGLLMIPGLPGKPAIIISKAQNKGGSAPVGPAP